MSSASARDRIASLSRPCAHGGAGSSKLSAQGAGEVSIELAGLGWEEMNGRPSHRVGDLLDRLGGKAIAVRGAAVELDVRLAASVIVVLGC